MFDSVNRNTTQTTTGTTAHRAGLLLLAYAIVQATLFTWIAWRSGLNGYAEGLLLTAVVFAIVAVVMVLVGKAIRP